MVSPGVPSNVADAIAKNPDDPKAMGNAVVSDVMRQKYGQDGATWGPAAAFDVLDLDSAKMRNLESSVKTLNDAIASHAGDRATAAELRHDAESVRGMVRFHDATPDMPWHADRPAMALYGKIASDGKLDAALRRDAAQAERAVSDIVIAHKESRSFQPFNGSSYSDAAGPTTHFPVKAGQVDPWAPRVSETHDRFFDETDAAAAERVIA